MTKETKKVKWPLIIDPLMMFKLSPFHQAAYILYQQLRLGIHNFKLTIHESFIRQLLLNNFKIKNPKDVEVYFTSSPNSDDIDSFESSLYRVAINILYDAIRQGNRSTAQVYYTFDHIKCVLPSKLIVSGDIADTLISSFEYNLQIPILDWRVSTHDLNNNIHVGDFNKFVEINFITDSEFNFKCGIKIDFNRYYISRIDINKSRKELLDISPFVDLSC